MPRVRVFKNAFNSGELDPLLYGRTDVEAYQHGAASLQNVVCLPQGGVRRRAGIAYTYSFSNNVRIVPFSFNTEQDYLLVFDSAKMYVFKDGVLQTNINGSGNDYLTTPWSLAEIDQAGMTQSADTLIVAHQSYSPRTITRGGSHTTWTLATISFTALPVEDFNENYDAVTFTLGAITGTGINLTASAGVFTAEHVNGRFEGPKGGVAEITGYTSTTQVTVDILVDFDSTTVNGKRAYLAEPAWTTEHGYPSVVTFHDGRLWFANTTTRPQTIWGSRSNLFYNYDFGTGLDDEAIAVTLDTDQVNAIRHLISMRHLQVMTTGGEFYFPDSPITPEKSAVQRTSRFGSSTVRPTAIDGATIFVQRTGKVIREFLYDFVENAYKANTVSLMATHLINSPSDMAAIRGTGTQDANYVFVVMGDGTLGVFNTLREQDVAGWSKWVTNGTFKRVAVVNEEAYFIINRGSTYYLGVQVEGTYTDLHKTETGLGSDTVTGLSHHNGETVEVRADGSIMNEQTVASGQITMERSGDDVEVGLGFDVQVKLLPVAAQFQDGQILLKEKRFTRVQFDLMNSLAVQADGKELVSRNFGASVLDTAATPYTGIKERWLTGWGNTKQITLTQNGPAPFTLRGVMMEVEA